MLFGFVDRTTTATSLNSDDCVLTSASQGPRVPGDDVTGPVDVDAVMVALADEQLRDHPHCPTRCLSKEGVIMEPAPEYGLASLGDLIYDPTHPDADIAGYVRMPNVDPTQELVTLMNARRLYTANATAFTSMKAMLRRAVDI